MAPTCAPFIGTKPFEETWLDFLEGWDKVKFAIGEEPVAGIYAQAVTRSVPAVSPSGMSSRRSAVSSPYVVSYSTLQSTDRFSWTAARRAGCCDVGHTVAWRWLRLLVHDGVLQRVTIGTRHRASEYCYVGD